MLTLLAGLGAVVCLMLRAFGVNNDDFDIAFLGFALWALAFTLFACSVEPRPIVWNRNP